MATATLDSDPTCVQKEVSECDWDVSAGLLHLRAFGMMDHPCERLLCCAQAKPLLLNTPRPRESFQPRDSEWRSAGNRRSAFRLPSDVAETQEVIHRSKKEDVVQLWRAPAAERRQLHERISLG